MLQTEKSELEAMMALVNNSSFQAFLGILDRQAEALHKRNEVPSVTHREADMNTGACRLIGQVKDICNAKDLKDLMARKTHNSFVREIVDSGTSLVG
jgi:hypothetical protein